MASEMIEKEKKIKDTERLYMNLREILSKHPGPQVAISLNKTQKALRQRGQKMKVSEQMPRTRAVYEFPETFSLERERDRVNSLAVNLHLIAGRMIQKRISQCLLAELSMYEFQVSEYRIDMDKMNGKMCELKKKYYSQKKKLLKSKELDSKSSSEPLLPAVTVCTKKFCGGGFNMTTPTPRSCFVADPVCH